MSRRRPLWVTAGRGSVPSGQPVLVTGQGWLGWLIGALFAIWLPVTLFGLLLAGWRGNAPGTALTIILLLGATDLAFLGSLVFSLRVEVFPERIVVRNWWWRDEVRWDEIKRVGRTPWPVPFGDQWVALFRRGRPPLHLSPPFAAQRVLVPYVIERVLEADPAAAVEDGIRERFVPAAPKKGAS